MTTLLAHYDAKTRRGFLASDRQCTAGNLVVSRESRKTRRAGKWLFGATGYSLLVTVLDGCLEDLAKCETPWEFSLRAQRAMRDANWEGAAPEDGNGPVARPGWILLLSCEGGWLIFGNGDPQPLDGPLGTGTGGDLAAGAYNAWLELSGGTPSCEGLRLALKIAIDRDIYSGGEPRVEVVQ